MGARTTILKADADRRLVFGYAIICKQDGRPYRDLQNDYIDEGSMLDASIGFMRHGRAAGEMHKSAGVEADFDIGDRRRIGDVLFAWPLTTDIAKAFGFPTDRTGLMIGMRIDEGEYGDEVLAKFRDGSYTGFSIEGKRLVQDHLDVEGNVVKTDSFEKREAAIEGLVDRIMMRLVS